MRPGDRSGEPDEPRSGEKTTDRAADVREEGHERSEDAEQAAQKRSALRFALAFPLFFIIMFPLAYVTALHQPVLHGFPVGVVGPPQEAQAQARSLSAELGGMFEFSTVESREQARQEIFEQDIKAAYIPGDEPTLLIAGADGRLATQFVPQAFTRIVSEQGGQLSVVDVAPLAPGDVTGIGLMFYMLIPILVGFVSANILGMAAGWFLSIRQRIGLSAVFAVLAAVVPWAFMGPWLKILQGSPGQIAAIISLAAVVSFIVGLFTTALVEIMGKWAIFVLITVFVFLNIPSSGATFPVEAIPPFFGFLSQFHIGHAFIEGLRAILYFHGEGIVQAVTVVGAWLLAGLGLLSVALTKKRRDERKAAKRDAGVEGGNAPAVSA